MLQLFLCLLSPVISFCPDRRCVLFKRSFYPLSFICVSRLTVTNNLTNNNKVLLLPFSKIRSIERFCNVAFFPIASFFRSPPARFEVWLQGKGQLGRQPKAIRKTQRKGQGKRKIKCLLNFNCRTKRLFCK